MRTIFTAITILLFLAGCTAPSEPIRDAPWQTIAGRDDAREPIYRARIPEQWHRQDPDPTISLTDSRLAICELTVLDAIHGDIKITIHNFPYDKFEDRIPPAAQVARWQRQLTEIDPTSIQTTPVGHGGFAGFLFEATGTFEGQQGTSVMGWAMQLAAEHFWNLEGQRRADYTIKVVGPARSVAKHRDEILRFARSFELIDEIVSAQETVAGRRTSQGRSSDTIVACAARHKYH